MLDVDSYDLWDNRAAPRKINDALPQGGRVCVLGSCFSIQLARHLGRLGYRASSHPSGELYNPEILRIELEHVLEGKPWPKDVAVPVLDGFVHRFRKRTQASTAHLLYEADARETEAIRGLLEGADVVLVLVGTTAELWRDREDDLATNEIPHPSIFEKTEWRLDLGDLVQMTENVKAVRDLLAEHTRAHVALAVCPIPLAATWDNIPISPANGRTKALLRMAVDGVPRTPRDSYVDMWDWIQTQTGRSTPMSSDGRHISERGAARIAALVAQRLGNEDAHPGLRQMMRSAITDVRTVRRHQKNRRAISDTTRAPDRA